MSNPLVENCVFYLHDTGCKGHPATGDNQGPYHVIGTEAAAYCGHCGEAVVTGVGWAIRGVSFTCEAGVGVWTLRDGTEWHCCVKEVTDDEIAELLIFDDTLDARLTVATA